MCDVGCVCGVVWVCVCVCDVCVGNKMCMCGCVCGGYIN